MSLDYDDRQQQEDEMCALDSIYGDKNGVFSFSEEPVTKMLSGKLRIDLPRLQTPLLVCIRAEGKAPKIFTMEFAGPVELRFQFPTDYPSNSAPIISMSSIWLTEHLVEKLKKKIAQVCEQNAGLPLLFFIRETIVDETADMKKFTGGAIDLDEFELNEIVISPRERLALIRKSDEDGETSEFMESSYECQVCFEHFLGADCTRFHPCKHVFCSSCATHYFKTMLNDSSVKVLECMADDCHSMAAHAELRKYLTEEEFERYERIILINGLESMGDVVPCARQACQVPVIVEPSDPTSSSLYNTVAQCTVCRYSFCLLCRKVNHGIEPCRYDSSSFEQTLAELESADEQKRQALFRMYGGEKHFMKQVENYKNEKWLQENSKKCPRCSNPIERSSGCNKMRCVKCNVDFCWLCREILTKNPYDHFNGGDVTKMCADKLFEGTEIDLDSGSDDEFVDYEFVDSDEEGDNLVTFLEGI